MNYDFCKNCGPMGLMCASCIEQMDKIEERNKQMEVAYGQSIKSNADLEQKHEALNIKKDNINPDHYKNQTSLECIEAMEIIFGKDAVIDFCRCNAWKYIWRWKNKNGKEDLRKADWYLTRAHYMTCGDDKRADMIRRMIHYVNNHRGEKCDG